MRDRNFTLLEFEEFIKQSNGIDIDANFDFIEEHHNDNLAFVEYKNGKFVLNIEKASQSFRKVPALATTRIIDDLKLLEATHGKFIQIVTPDGNPIFSNEDVLKVIDAMRGLPGHGNFVVSDELDFAGIENYTAKDQNGEDAIDRTSRRTDEKRKKITAGLSEKFGESIHYHLIETGSTARNTAVISDEELGLVPENSEKKEDPDFDYVARVASIGESNSYLAKQNLTYTRGKVRKLPVADTEVDITFLVIPEENRDYLSSEQAIEKRLANIREKHGEETYKKVLANIIQAKKVLKEAGIYKAAKSRSYGDKEYGGLGGMGIENWILQHGKGSFLQASKEFLEIIDSLPEGLSEEDRFLEFQKRFSVIDSGKNHMSVAKNFFPYDNYVMNNMRIGGFKKMEKALREFVKQQEALKAKANETGVEQSESQVSVQGQIDPEESIGTPDIAVSSTPSGQDSQDILEQLEAPKKTKVTISEFKKASDKYKSRISLKDRFMKNIRDFTTGKNDKQQAGPSISD